jgi:hypothetical protein
MTTYNSKGVPTLNIRDDVRRNDRYKWTYFWFYLLNEWVVAIFYFEIRFLFKIKKLPCLCFRDKEAILKNRGY